MSEREARQGKEAGGSRPTRSEAEPSEGPGARARARSEREVRPSWPADAKPAGGLEAIVGTAVRATREMGVVRGLRTLALVNQSRGFDCPGCAWPDPEQRHAVEFCENGAKAVAHEATTRRLGRAFFERWSIAELLEQSDHVLEQQGRLTEPLYRAPDAEHYRAIAWDEALGRVAAVLRGLDSPDEAVFYTSGRTSNEAAFLYQLFARQLGTNNLPDCSHMCHESSGFGLTQVIGVGKGTVSLPDFERADAIFVIGQNPGTNHPRMLTTLQAAKRRGATIVAINPLRERGLVRFAHPQEPLALLGGGTPIADLYLQVRVGGDVALLKGIMKEVLAAEARRPGEVLDWSFLREHTAGFEEFRSALERQPWEPLLEQSGVSREDLRRAAEVYVGAGRTIVCWAMGLTQHRNAVANVQEIVNLLLLRGNLGRPGAGPCPVRGHSNVQGDRTVGITEKPSEAFLDRLGREFRFEPPRRRGHDAVGAIRAMHEGRVRVFVGLGGNFAVATPDTAYTAEALRHCQLTVQISTKLNRSHLVCGREAIVLPCLGRTELDVQAGGPQLVSVENSMSIVHASRGHLAPAGEQLRSEPAIVAGLAEATLRGRSRVGWSALVENYDRIRSRIERVIPGFEDYNRRVRTAGGFLLPSGARTRRFATPDGRAHFTRHPLPELGLAAGRLRLTTIRSHDQYNTTVYGLGDRYRGVSGGRRVVFLHPDDMRERGLAQGDRVDVTSHFRGEKRSVRGFRVVPYDLPRGCAAAYFPEANPLVAVDDVAEGSRTPVYKSIEVSIAPAR
jgi:molybdopterin-dependent oxidoreductase alpha subunit